MKRLLSIAALALGAVLLIVGTLLLTFVPLKVDQEVAKRIYLGIDSNGTYSEVTRKWVDPQYEMRLQVWLLSVTNPDQVLQGAMPVLEEKGPYCFDEQQHKTRVEFTHNQTRVSYRNKRWYWFDAHCSCTACSLQDNVTVPNVVFQKLVDIALESGAAVRQLLELVLRLEKRETPFISASVAQMLFDGYEDPLISAVCSKPLLKPLCDAVSVPSKVGFMYGRNGSDDGEYVIGTGLLDRQDIGKVYLWNGADHVNCWATQQANMINGTDGQLYASFPADTMHIFTGQIPRSLKMHMQESRVSQGISVVRMSTTADNTDYSLLSNRGFCVNGTPHYVDVQPEGCLPRGLMDMSVSLSGNPRIYVSAPHFLDSTPSLYWNLSGLPPPSSQDRMYIDIEPVSGVVVQVKATSQINVGMVAGNLRSLSRMHNMVMPVLWFNESIRIDDESKTQLIHGFLSLKHTVFIMGVATLSIGVMLWVVFLSLAMYTHINTPSCDDSEQLIVQEDNGI